MFMVMYIEVVVALHAVMRAHDDQVGGEAFFLGLLEDPDPRIAYHASVFLLESITSTVAAQNGRLASFHAALRDLVVRAQQTADERLLENPYFTVVGVLPAFGEHP